MHFKKCYYFCTVIVFVCNCTTAPALTRTESCGSGNEFYSCIMVLSVHYDA